MSDIQQGVSNALESFTLGRRIAKLRYIADDVWRSPDPNGEPNQTVEPLGAQLELVDAAIKGSSFQSQLKTLRSSLRKFKKDFLQRWAELPRDQRIDTAGSDPWFDGFLTNSPTCAWPQTIERTLTGAAKGLPRPHGLSLNLAYRLESFIFPPAFHGNERKPMEPPEELDFDDMPCFLKPVDSHDVSVPSPAELVDQDAERGAVLQRQVMSIAREVSDLTNQLGLPPPRYGYLEALCPDPADFILRATWALYGVEAAMMPPGLWDINHVTGHATLFAAARGCMTSKLSKKELSLLMALKTSSTLMTQDDLVEACASEISTNKTVAKHLKTLINKNLVEQHREPGSKGYTVTQAGRELLNELRSGPKN